MTTIKKGSRGNDVNKRKWLNVFNHIPLYCLSLSKCRTMNALVSCANNFGKFVCGIEYTNFVTACVNYLNSLPIAFAQRLTSFLCYSVKRVVVMIRTPFKVFNMVVFFVLVLMIYTRIIVGVWNEILRNYSMNMFIRIFRVFTERYTGVSVRCSRAFEYETLKKSVIQLLTSFLSVFVIVRKPFNPTKAAYLVQSFITFNWFPNFCLHNIKQIAVFKMRSPTSANLLTANVKFLIPSRSLVYSLCKDTKNN